MLHIAIVLCKAYRGFHSPTSGSAGNSMYPRGLALRLAHHLAPVRRGAPRGEGHQPFLEGPAGRRGETALARARTALANFHLALARDEPRWRELLFGVPVFYREVGDVLEVADVSGYEHEVVHRCGRGEKGVGHLDRLAALAQRGSEIGGGERYLLIDRKPDRKRQDLALHLAPDFA